MRDGFLNIIKPKNMTSFDVVAVLRKALGVKKIGHLGTLDPMAEGVLPIAVGKATRLIEYLDKGDKTYEAKVLFGKRTDTDDIWGEVLENGDASWLKREDVIKILPEFTGSIFQVPPKYSAIKVSGKKLYEYARAGQDVDIKERHVTIHKIELLEFRESGSEEARGEAYDAARGEGSEAKLLIDCSKGTYIRSLARDMGNRLGCLGTMSGLIRTRSGGFRIEDGVLLDEIVKLGDHSEVTISAEVEKQAGTEILGGIEKLIIPMDKALLEMPSVTLGDWEAKLFGNGVKLRDNQWNSDEGDYFRVYNSRGAFLGIGKPLETGELSPDKVIKEE